MAFLDLNMPDMSGFELAAALRALPGASPLKLYAVTGMGQKTDRELALAAGFDGHLTKPVSPDVVARLAAGVVDDAGSLHAEPTAEANRQAPADS